MAYEGNAKIARMVQPESLRGEEFQEWSRGRGEDVWMMFCAAIAGDLETIRELVAKDPNLINCEYQYLTPLRFAVRENRRAVADFLLEKGVNPVYMFGDSLLTIARDRGYAELVALFESILRDKYHIIPEGAIIAAAIKNCDPALALAILEKQPALLHAADEQGNQPIHWAVLTRQVDLINRLLNLGADIHAMRPDGARPIDLTNGDYFYRSWYRDLPPTGLRKHEVLVGYLMARGAYCDISVAARIGYYDRVKELLDQDPNLANRVPSYSGYYSGLPLRVAAGAGYSEIVKLLIERGANPNEPEQGIAPHGGALHAAISGKHFEIVKMLLVHGANTNAAVESSGNCLSLAKHVVASREMTDLIASYGGTLTVELVCYYGELDTISEMLHSNPQLNLESGIGYIISEGHQQCMELILRFQPDILKKFAVKEIRTPEFARWLMERGLDPNSCDWLGATLLHHAASAGNIELAEVCLEFGAEINAIDTDFSSSPLGWAARNGKKEMLEWLLKKGADPELPGDEPWALPIEWARRRGYEDITRILL
ncbi:MAG: ankyrin repeat domain-containing protein [Ferruginibacter sp.]